MAADVRHSRGSTVDRIVLSTKRPTTVIVPDEPHLRARTEAANADLSFVDVDLAVPHGPKISCRIPLIGRFVQHTIDLVPDNIPRWLAWAAAEVNLRARASFSDTSAYHVWGRLWAYRLGAWRPVDLAVDKIESNDYAKQFELTTREPSVLQIGGPAILPRLVSLPEGRAKVLLKANAETAASGDPLNIVVSRVTEGPRNTLLSLLSMNHSMYAESVAKELGSGFDWKGIGDDPLSGCALGYAAMRLRALDRFTLSDARSLFQLARGSSDAAIVLAARELADNAPDLSRVIRLLDVGIGRGVPVLAQSLAAATAALDDLRRRPIQTDEKMLATLTEKARGYSQAKAGEGSFLSFYGQAPHMPGRQQQHQSYDHHAIRRFGAAVASVASVFKPMSATVLINTERSIEQPQHAGFDTAR
ncbi:hypothetical protein [Caballeronia novacaledonica]|uniref:hypothetical protein n=1 Tax=Caballeronia novacaledonica TaxID=1544861 RepID=UPI0011B24C83|nr:hypothetical protein [Caballeronia novacaledonica]